MAKYKPGHVASRVHQLRWKTDWTEQIYYREEVIFGHKLCFTLQKQQQQTNKQTKQNQKYGAKKNYFLQELRTTINKKGAFIGDL